MLDHNESICLDPNKALSWIDLGDAYQHQDNFQQAMSCYDQAIRLDPDKPLCWIGLARLLKRAGQCDVAMAALSTVFDAGKPDLLALLLRAEIYRCQGDIEHAVSDYNEAILLEPSNTLIRLDLARLFEETKQYDKGEAIVSVVLEADPRNLEARTLRAKFYQRLGASDRAMADASEAVRQHPERAEAYSTRALLHNVVENYDKALVDADRAIEIDPGDRVGNLQRGFAHLQLKHHQQAIHDLTEALKLDPLERSAWMNRAWAFKDQGKYKEAVADMLQATKVDPKSSAPFNSLAWLLATCPDSTVRDGKKAAGYIDQALELQPDRWTIWDTRAAVSAENGDFKDAVAWEERCLDRKDLSETERRTAIERLALYRAGKPYREEPP
jgi:tetratricopeptide (TPR) repeat protein